MMFLVIGSIMSLQWRCFMNISRKEIFLFFAIVLIAAFRGMGIAYADEKTTIKKYPIPAHGVLELNVPASWKAAAHKPQENMPPTIIFSPSKGNDFEIIITVFWNKEGEVGFNSPDKVRALLEKDGRKLLSRTMETKIVLNEIKGMNHPGYYFSVTDKNPEPGEYRYMTRAGIGVGDLLLQVTLLHRVKESGAVKETLSMLRQAKQTPK